MRLLRYNNDGGFSLIEFFGNIPQYAIFSHTWGAEEVTFEDLITGVGKTKASYAKVRFCGEQAMSDGLRYFWIDTCCIDKTSSAELTEAIYSMFRWFAEAAICYVYLSDLSINNHGENDHLSQTRWETAFRMSRWFTRGWTLQELIAPRYLEFYAVHGTKLGTRRSLNTLISEITGIPAEVLNHSKRLDEYSVPERMAWASRRSTSRIEDRAYCLMGLFDVNMPLLYGEGDYAFQRLQKEIVSLTNQTSGLRLLDVHSIPLAIETFASQDEPDYAILSHIWNTNEVSFQDVVLGKAPSRRGYQKIKNCCEQAARHGFKYLWVNTCCIDKTSSAKLQEAICSMYKWYRNAQICYVYLENYKSRGGTTSELSSCKWFKRGWTLQELIAPSSVEFYDSKWNSFGTKISLCLQLADITGIDPLVLRGADPTRQTVAERMSWASRRSTSRIEDTAYSLIGLFNVFMPILYGEEGRAFIRLQEEIMKQSEDYTIFAWKCAGLESCKRGLFARSPAEFNSHVHFHDKTSDSLQFTSQYTTPAQQLHKPATLTRRGMLIALPLLQRDVLKIEVSEPGEVVRHRIFGRARGRGF
ncbi:hypothetical protein IFR05_016582, partial [Cadophora sp. M221]